MRDLGFPPLKLSRFSPSTMMRLCNLFCNPLCARNLRTRFPIRGRVETSQGLNSCNHTSFMDVIKGLNQIFENSIRFYPNSKTRTEFHFSYEIR
jgi:hypothetical protein